MLTTVGFVVKVACPISALVSNPTLLSSPPDHLVSFKLPSPESISGSPAADNPANHPDRPSIRLSQIRPYEISRKLTLSQQTLGVGSRQ